MITVVGIGADGWQGLAPIARHALADAEAIVGSARQLALVPQPSPASEAAGAGASGAAASDTAASGAADSGTAASGAMAGGAGHGSTAERVVLPSPLLPNLPGLLDSLAGRRACFLASGDPMHHGIGSTLVRLLGADRVRVLPHVSSISLACARLGWPVESVEVVNLVGRPPATLRMTLAPGRRVLVLGASIATTRALLADAGYTPSPITVLADLDAPTESIHTPTRDDAGLQVIAVECVASPGVEPLARVPGLPDEAYESDGQLTKREVRAVSLSRLAPLPGALLWDVGAGAGSVAIEWMRTHPSCGAVAIEHRADRAERLRRNAETLGVAALRVVQGKAPDALAGLPAPDAVFVGGGATAPGMLDACWEALRPGGRLVVNAVTLESETLVADWYGRFGGDLVRLSVDRASPVGRFTAWRPAMPVTIWSVTKPAHPAPPTAPDPGPAHAGTEPAHPGTEPAHAETEPARPGTEAARSGTEAARSGTEAARSGTEAARSGTEAARSGNEAARSKPAEEGP